MANYNFFEPYIEPPKKINYERLFWIVLTILIIMAMLFLFMRNFGEINNSKNEISKLDAQIQSPDLQKSLIEVDQLESEMLEVQNTYTKLRLLDEATKLNLAFDYNVFKELNAWLPENAFLKDLNYSGGGLGFNGYGDSIETVALFKRQLSESNRFYGVNLDSLMRENDNYAFSMYVGLSALAATQEFITEEDVEKESEQDQENALEEVEGETENSENPENKTE